MRIARPRHRFTFQKTMKPRSDGSTLFTYTLTAGTQKTVTHVTVLQGGDLYPGIAPMGNNVYLERATDLFKEFVFDYEAVGGCVSNPTPACIAGVVAEAPGLKDLKIAKKLATLRKACKRLNSILPDAEVEHRRQPGLQKVRLGRPRVQPGRCFTNTSAHNQAAAPIHRN
ncbi:hypothetical protein V2W30_39990 (plasmid) [Streptomyces sp. Q6]|uniref:Uncharacterized protein n=1 Tax=Streptomyces citrinus TaxID=3118173 RepID=A0ACD5AR20_9ACTN